MVVRCLINSSLIGLISLNCLAADLTIDSSRFFVEGTEIYNKRCDAMTWEGVPQMLMRRQRRSQANGSFVELERPANEKDPSSIYTKYTPLVVDKTDLQKPSVLTYRFSITTTASAMSAPLKSDKSNKVETSMEIQTLNGLLKISDRSELSETWTYNFDFQHDSAWSSERGVLIRSVIIMESDVNGKLIAINGQDYYSSREGFLDRYRCTFSPK